MKVSYIWLQKYFDTPLPSPEKLAEAITFHAFEIDGVEKKGSDTVLDVKVLPDRAHDCLSHRGIAKEISIITKAKLRSDPLVDKPALSKRTNSLTVSIADPNLCARYAVAVIRGVKVKPSPRWLKERLEALGQKSVNNIVDATNFVMFNVGQPLHAFDAGKLTERSSTRAIIVRTAAKGETVTTLDGKEYAPAPSMLLITDGTSREAIGIAGIKGGRSAEISEKTKDIILESANFNAVSIRKASQALKLRTDASTRFENELSPELVPYGLVGAVELIQKLAGGELEGYVDEYPKPQESWTVSVSRDETNHLLGTKMSTDDIEDILKRFGFVYEFENDAFHVAVPFERLDLRIKEDLIADIGRIYGYENIPTIAPSPFRRPVEVNRTFYYAERIRTFLVERGFSEVYTSVFSTKGERAVLNKVESDTPYLRTSLISSLQAALEMNFKNRELFGLSEVRLFEIGTVWSDKEEKLLLALAIKGDKKSPKPSQVLAELTEALGKKAPEALEKGNAVEIELGPYIEKLPEPKAYEKAQGIPEARYKPFSRYPFALRDIAVWVSEETSVADVEKTIIGNAGELLVMHKLFDEFKKDGKTSYAFRLVFQSFDRTLSDEHVNEVMGNIAAALKTRNWEVR